MNLKIVKAMKHLAFVILSCLTLYSCSENNALTSGSYPQKWKLAKMTGSMIPSETTGEDMTWQESYVLYTDHTFVKSSTRKEGMIKAEGTYTIENTTDRKRLVLTYKSDNDIIGNCTSEPEEHLYFNSNNNLVNDWSMCDGPGLEYIRVD